MRKILNLILITTFGLLIAGCSDDNDSAETSLKVIKSTNISFDAAGGQGTIEVSSASSIEATVDQAWCAISVNGTTISLTASENYGLEGRNALVTISSGGETTSVSISQLGTLFGTNISEVTFNVSEAGEAKIAILANSFPIELTSNDSWIKAKVEKDSVTINVDATAAPRQGTLTLTCGKRTIDIDINQTILKYDDLIGNWTLTSYNFAKTEKTTEPVIISKVEGDKSYILSKVGNLDVSCVINFNSQTGQLSLSSQYLGTIGAYHAYITIIDTSAGSLTWNTTIQYAAKVDTSDPSKLVYRFYDNHSWTDQITDGIGITAFDNKIEDNGKRLGEFQILTDLVLTKQ